MRRGVVITGVGAVSPLGLGAEPLLDRWCAGECGIEDGAGRCRDFDPLDFLSRKEARRSDRFAQLALAAASQAVAQAGFEADLPYEPHRVGCVFGTGIGGLGSLEQQHRKLVEGGERTVSPLSVPLMMGNAASAAVAMRHGLRGQAYGVVSACAAGAHAIGDAARMIRAGDVDAVLAGGAEAGITSLATSAFTSMGATSKSGISRPFDARRDGFVIGEGAGALMLEDADAAIARGAQPLAEVLGYGATCDAFHLTAPEPSGRDAAQAIRLALRDAGVTPAELDYVNAHGTSTQLNDRSETEALKLALGERAGELPVSSTKSALGHLLGAAGAVEAIATIGALGRGVAPPTVGWEVRDEELDLDYVPGVARPLQGPAGDVRGRLSYRRNGVEGDGAERPPFVAISNSFGFGGHNAVLCLAA